MTAGPNRVPERQFRDLRLRVERDDGFAHAIELCGRDLEIQRVERDRLGGLLDLHLDDGSTGERQRAGIGLDADVVVDRDDAGREPARALLARRRLRAARSAREADQRSGARGCEDHAPALWAQCRRTLSAGGTSRKSGCRSPSAGSVCKPRKEPDAELVGRGEPGRHPCRSRTFSVRSAAFSR